MVCAATGNRASERRARSDAPYLPGYKVPWSLGPWSVVRGPWSLMMRIPFYKPSIGEDEIGEVVDTLRSGWLTTGPKTKQFEMEFAEYLGHKHAVAVNSCTA